MFQVYICIVNNKFDELELTNRGQKWVGKNKTYHNNNYHSSFSQDLSFGRKKIIFWVILESICEALTLPALDPLSHPAHRSPPQAVFSPWVDDYALQRKSGYNNRDIYFLNIRASIKFAIILPPQEMFLSQLVLLGLSLIFSTSSS